MVMLQIDLNDENPEEWDNFVFVHKASTFFHQIGWKDVVERTYGHKPLYLVARENRNIRGILPLFLMKHILFGKFLISVPYGDYGGICAEDEETSNALLAKAMEIARNKDVKFLELRHVAGINREDLMTKTSRAMLMLPLEKDAQTLWKSFNPKVRNQVRKAEKSGIKAEIGDKSLVREFYKVYAYNMRDLGTPVHSISFFENILNVFHSNSNIILVRLDESPIGGAIAIYFKDTMEIPWASSLREFFPLCPNNLLYWRALEYGCSKGYKYFSFGRSPWKSGTFQFKKQWGAEPVQLNYQYYVNNSDEMPDYTPSTNSRFDIAIRIWRKLPVSISIIIGPRIISGIPY
jgi:serine/alanine adding enzyme